MPSLIRGKTCLSLLGDKGATKETLTLLHKEIDEYIHYKMICIKEKIGFDFDVHQRRIGYMLTPCTHAF